MHRFVAAQIKNEAQRNEEIKEREIVRPFPINNKIQSRTQSNDKILISVTFNAHSMHVSVSMGVVRSFFRRSFNRFRLAHCIISFMKNSSTRARCVNWTELNWTRANANPNTHIHFGLCHHNWCMLSGSDWDGNSNNTLHYKWIAV